MMGLNAGANSYTRSLGREYSSKFGKLIEISWSKSRDCARIQRVIEELVLTGLK